MRERLAAGALVALGLLQMAGDVLRSPTLKGLAAATAASPAPRVFSTVKSYETFSGRFTVEWTGRDGRLRTLALDPVVYARIRGPYNRRNVYGAIVAGAPLLTADPRLRPMFDAISRHAFCGEAPLLRELGVDPSGVARPPRLRIATPKGETFVVEAPCR
jgi:hypothetical protein